MRPKEQNEETEKITKNFSNILNKLIDENFTEKEISDSYIAKKINLDRKSIADYRNGNLLPDTANLLKLSKFGSVQAKS